MIIVLLALVAFLWFFVLPFYDIFFNQSQINNSIMHFFGSSTLGNIAGIIGCVCVIVAMLGGTLQFFAALARLFTKKPRQ